MNLISLAASQRSYQPRLSQRNRFTGSSDDADDLEDSEQEKACNCHGVALAGLRSASSRAQRRAGGRGELARGRGLRGVADWRPL
eukprot:SM000038S14305  [mRNA]  locus=s38:140461:140888:+ [translate_table: standard]